MVVHNAPVFWERLVSLTFNAVAMITAIIQMERGMRARKREREREREKSVREELERKEKWMTRKESSGCT